MHVRRNYVMGEEGVTKGKHVRSVPMADQVLVALDELSRREHFTAAGDVVFCTDVGGHRRERRSAQSSTQRSSAPAWAICGARRTRSSLTTFGTRSGRWRSAGRR